MAAVRPEPGLSGCGNFEVDRGGVDKPREVFQNALEFYDDEHRLRSGKMETLLKLEA